MKIALNCCTKPAVTPLFKGQKPESAAQPQVKPEQVATAKIKEQPKQDSVVISNKKIEEKKNEQETTMNECVCKCKCEKC